MSDNTPAVVTICGSMRFFPQMLEAAADLTGQGHIVLAPFSVVAPEDQAGDFKAMLDRLHLNKIDMASRVVVVTDQHEYIGDSTRREMIYAYEACKPVEVRKFAVDWPAAPMAAPRPAAGRAHPRRLPDPEPR